MGIITDLFRLVGLAAPRFPDKELWEERTRRAAVTVLGDESVSARFLVGGGFGEYRRMRITAEVACISPEDRDAAIGQLEALYEQVVAAVAPVVVRIPDPEASLMTRLICRCELSQRPIFERSDSLRLLAEKFGLERWHK